MTDKSVSMNHIVAAACTFFVIATSVIVCADNANTSTLDSITSPLYAIKFDPFVGSQPRFVGSQPRFTAASRIKYWKSIGFNAVFLIIQSRHGQTLLPTNAEDVNSRGYSYDEEMFSSADILKDIAVEASRQGITLFVGNWMFRENSLYKERSDWRQINAKGVNGNELLLCPNSRYMIEVFYPKYQNIIKDYGIRNIFLQEMWFEEDGARAVRSCYCENCLRQFSEKEGTPFMRDGLLNAMAESSALTERWDQFHYDTLKRVVQRLDEMVGDEGNVLWHNPVMDWGYLRNDQQFRDSHWIGDMSLYPDEQIFVEGDPNVIDPFLQYSHVRRFTDVFGYNHRLLEYIGLYGMPGLDRAIKKQDIYNLHLAARAAGMTGFMVEQDAMINWAEKKNAGIWAALADCFKILDTAFESAEYQGEVADSEVIQRAGKIYGGWWRTPEGTKIVIVGNRIEFGDSEYRLVGSEVLDGFGNQVSGEGKLSSGEVKLFVIKK